MKYTVIGAGGMGIQFGVLLQELAGCDVDFIDGWSRNVETIRTQGGAYVSQDGQDRHLVPINVYYPEEYQGNPDAWIIFVKQQQLEDLLRRCSPHFQDHQVVFSAMNGYGHFERIAQYFAKNKIYGGTALIGAYVYGPGDFNFTGGAHAKAMNICAYDEHKVTEDPIEQQIVADFTAASLNPTVVPDFMGMCLAKIVFNSVLNTLCTMYEIRFGEFAEHPSAPVLTESLVNEAYNAAQAAGITLLGTRESEVETIMHTASIAHPLHYPSMYQDLTRCRPTEVDYINGFIAKLGRENGSPCPLHEFVTQEVHLAEHAFKIHNPQIAKQAALDE